MINDYDTAVWAEHHASFSDNVRRLVSTVMVSLRRLHAIQYEAPWRED